MTAIERSADGGPARFVVVLSDGRRYPARHVVVAAGAWANEVTRPLGIRVPVSPVKGVIWTSGPAAPGTLQKVWRRALPRCPCVIPIDL